MLDGLFLYMAVTALYGNQMFERFLLFFTEQAAYPPNHYIKRVPQRKIHTFTCLQLVDLAILCVFGFMKWPYVKMIFPIVLALFLPIRWVKKSRMIVDANTHWQIRIGKIRYETRFVLHYILVGHF